MALILPYVWAKLDSSVWDTLYMREETMCPGQGGTVLYVELETDLSVYLQGEALCEGSGLF